jgi:hypothetical protein
MNNQTKLTLDIIGEYIRNNLGHFKPSDEEIIIVQNTKKINTEKSNHIKPKLSLDNSKIICEKKNIDDILNDILINESIKFPLKYFEKLSFVDLLESFLLFKPSCEFTIDEKEYSYSFYSCILSSLNNDYIKATDKYKFNSINNLISYLKSDIAIDGYKNHGYSKIGWKKNDLIKDINNNKISDMVIRYITDALHINLFLIDEKHIKYFGGDFIVFKNIVIILNHNDKYYLICTEKDKYFRFNSNDLIKQILLNSDKLKLVFSESFNYTGYNLTLNPISKINEIKTIETTEKIEYTDRLNGYESESESESESELDSNNVNDEISDNIFHKDINENQSLIDLQKKAKELNIEIFYTGATARRMKNKKELCKEIINKIKS